MFKIRPSAEVNSLAERLFCRIVKVLIEGAQIRSKKKVMFIIYGSGFFHVVMIFSASLLLVAVAAKKKQDFHIVGFSTFALPLSP